VALDIIQAIEKSTHKQTGEEFEAERASNELLKPIKALGN
jgi:hypothetical protein